MSKIFISYRHDDTAGFIERFFEAFKERLPNHEIFRDVGGIKVSEDWVNKLSQEIEKSQMVLILIGANWMLTTSDGQRRIDNSKDILRREVEWASKQGVPVTPVLVGNAMMPKESELPSDMKYLHRLQAHRIRDESFDADIDALAARLQELFDEVERRSQEAGKLLDELMEEKLEFTPGAVYIENFAVAGDWNCEVRSSIYNDQGFASDGRATIRFSIPDFGGTFKGTWKSEREFRIEGNWMIGATDPNEPKRVTCLRLQGVLDGVDPFTWEIPIAERTGDGYSGVDAQGRHYFSRLVQPPKPHLTF